MKAYAVTKEGRRQVCAKSSIPVELVMNERNEGLPRLYNEILKRHRETDEPLVLVHDDLIINDVLVEEKLNASEGDVIGIAGTSGYDPEGFDQNRPVGWWSMGRKFRLAGGVTHDDGKMAWTTSYGPAPARVAAIDGCFMAIMRPRRVPDFDESFDFHFYDLSFCMRCCEMDLKLMVEPILCTHLSIGQSALTTAFMEAQGRFMGSYFQGK